MVLEEPGMAGELTLPDMAAIHTVHIPPIARARPLPATGHDALAPVHDRPHPRRLHGLREGSPGVRSGRHQRGGRPLHLHHRRLQRLPHGQPGPSRAGSCRRRSGGWATRSGTGARGVRPTRRTSASRRRRAPSSNGSRCSARAPACPHAAWQSCVSTCPTAISSPSTGSSREPRRPRSHTRPSRCRPAKEPSTLGRRPLAEERPRRPGGSLERPPARRTTEGLVRRAAGSVSGQELPRLRERPCCVLAMTRGYENAPPRSARRPRGYENAFPFCSCGTPEDVARKNPRTRSGERLRRSRDDRRRRGEKSARSGERFLRRSPGWRPGAIRGENPRESGRTPPPSFSRATRGVATENPARSGERTPSFSADDRRSVARKIRAVAKEHPTASFSRRPRTPRPSSR